MKKIFIVIIVCLILLGSNLYCFADPLSEVIVDFKVCSLVRNKVFKSLKLLENSKIVEKEGFTEELTIHTDNSDIKSCGYFTQYDNDSSGNLWISPNINLTKKLLENDKLLNVSRIDKSLALGFDLNNRDFVGAVIVFNSKDFSGYKNLSMVIKGNPPIFKLELEDVDGHIGEVIVKNQHTEIWFEKRIKLDWFEREHNVDLSKIKELKIVFERYRLAYIKENQKQKIDFNGVFYIDEISLTNNEPKNIRIR